MKILLFVFILILSFSCKESEKQNSETDYTQQNVTILLDLSDRIIAQSNPSQIVKDISSIMQILDSFKEKIAEKGTFNSDDKIKVIFYPPLDDSRIAEISQNLNVNFENLHPIEKKKLFRNIDSIYLANISSLYKIASNQKIFTGADLFNYFKDRIEDDCINTEKNYQNILCIFTDGYLYSANEKMNSGNRFSFIGPNSEHIKIFRGNPDWYNQFSKLNYGFIKLNKNLSKLNILVAEIAPINSYPRDFEILKKYWEKWLNEMNAKSLKFIKSDLPSINKQIIKNHLARL